jgi:hypothetical protein
MTDDLIPRRMRCTSNRGKRRRVFGADEKALTTNVGIPKRRSDWGKSGGHWKSRRKAKLVGRTCGNGM